MKTKLIIIAIFFGLFWSCKSFDPKLLNASGQPFNPKLPAMEKVVENNLVAIVSGNGTVIGANPQDVVTIFDREVTEIMTDPYSDKKGVLVLKVNNLDSKFFPHIAYTYLTATLLNVMGVPFVTATESVEIQIDVLDQNRKLVGSYRGSGKQKLKAGYYSKTNYGGVNLKRVAYLMAVKSAIQEAKTKMIPELGRLANILNK